MNSNFHYYKQRSYKNIIDIWTIILIIWYKLGLDTSKHVFQVATGSCPNQPPKQQRLDRILRHSDIIFFHWQITKALISLCGCPGWSVLLLFCIPQRQVWMNFIFSVQESVRSNFLRTVSQARVTDFFISGKHNVLTCRNPILVKIWHFRVPVWPWKLSQAHQNLINSKSPPKNV